MKCWYIKTAAKVKQQYILQNVILFSADILKHKCCDVFYLHFL